MNTCLIRLNIILFLIIKHLGMFNMSDLSIALWWTEKSYTFSFKDTSLGLLALDILPRQNSVGKLTFLLSALSF